MTFGYNGRQKSNLTIILSALLILSRAADFMLLDGPATTSNSLSCDSARALSGEQHSETACLQQQ
jgi:hypothetical protein